MSEARATGRTAPRSLRIRGLVAIDGFYFTNIQWKPFLWLGLVLTRDDNFRRECSLSS